MIDFAQERVLTFTQAAHALPRRRRNRPVSPSTIYRWAGKGVRGVILESLQTPAGRITTAEAIVRFFARLTSRLPTDTTRSVAKRGHADRRAGAELQRLGL